MKKALLSAIVLAGAMAMSAAPANSTFTYGEPDEQVQFYGSNKVQVYDIAIEVNNPQLSGMTITSIQVPLIPAPETEVTGLKFFITKELQLEMVDGKNVNVADLEWDAVYPTEANQEDGTYLFTFNLPDEYVIGDAPVYVGYELTVKKLNRNNQATSYPIAVKEGSATGALWMRASRAVLKWTDKSAEVGAVSAMCLNLKGEVADNAVGIPAVSEYVAPRGEATTVKAWLTNMGSTDVTSIEYRSEVGNTSADYTLDLAEAPLRAVMGVTREVTLQVPASLALGRQDVKIAITKVNGQPNQAGVNWAGTTANIIPFIPKPSPVYEEFTGTQCGYCTRGIASMEYMRETYGDDFLVAVWHSGYNTSDPMFPASGYPHLTSGAPSGYMNRIESADPWYGLSNSEYGFESLWQNYMQQIYPADVRVWAVKDADNASLVNIASEVHWAYIPDAEGDYRMEYILLGDGLHGEGADWAQSNNYSTANGMYLMENFIGKGSKVAGLYFNDVALLSSKVGGTPGTVAIPEVDGRSVNTTTLDTNNAINNNKVNGRPQVIAFDPAHLRVLALLLQANGGVGRIIAAAQCNVMEDGSGIDNISGGLKSVVATEYFDLTGRRITNPAAGTLVIRLNRYSDGTTDAVKFIAE